MAKQNPIDEAKELQSMLVSYAKQQTYDPLTKLAKYVGIGVAGAVLTFLGVMFVGLGVLRLLQEQTGDVFAGLGLRSIVPYLGSLFAMAILVLILFLAMNKATKAVR